MLRQKYQERFIKTKKVKRLEEEIKDVFYLFEELYEDINNQSKTLQTIEDKIQNSKEEILIAEDKVEVSNETNNKIKKFEVPYYMFIGGGIGSLAIIYNPYIGISSIVGGMFLGSILGYIK